MPFYEYRCKECRDVTEFRSSMEKKEEVASALKCEHCGSVEFTQVIGGIAITGSSKNSEIPVPSTTGGCCPGGMCGL